MRAVWRSKKQGGKTVRFSLKKGKGKDRFVTGRTRCDICGAEVVLVANHGYCHKCGNHFSQGIDGKVERITDKRPFNYCQKCGREMTPVEYAISPICGKCVKKAHKELFGR